jgi:RNAse (barnase) inhibitor barstar
MSSDAGILDLWQEIEGKLKRTSGVLTATTLAAVNDADAGWLRRTETSNEVEAALVQALEQHPTYFHRVIIQGVRCTTTPDLLRTLGDALEFPSYYGRNWDALNECLLDLLTLTDDRLGSYFGDRVGRRARSLVLTVDDAQHLLEKEPRDQVDTLLEVLRWVASRPADPLGRDLPRGQLFVLLRLRPTVGRGNALSGWWLSSQS